MTLVPITRSAPVADPRFGRAYAAPTAGGVRTPMVARVQAGPPSSLRALAASRRAQTMTRSLGMGDTTTSPTQDTSRYASDGSEGGQQYYGGWDTTREYQYPLSAIGLGAAPVPVDASVPPASSVPGGAGDRGYYQWEYYYGANDYHYPAQAIGLGQATSPTSTATPSLAAEILNEIPGAQSALQYLQSKYIDFVALGGRIQTLRQQADSTSSAIGNAGGDTTSAQQVVSDASSLQDDYNAVMNQIESIADVLRQEGILGQLLTVAVVTTIVAIAGAMAYVYSKYATVQAALSAVASKQLSSTDAANILGAGGGGSGLSSFFGGISLTTIAVLVGGYFLLKKA